MSAFLTKLITMDDGNGETVQLAAPLVYHSDLAKRDITVPTGFTTDYASVPRGLWNLVPKEGAHSRAAVVHDFLYVANGLTRVQADAIFKEALLVCGLSAFKANAMWLAVRVGGGKAWDRYRARPFAGV